MKKLAVLAIAALVSASAFAQTAQWIGNGYTIINGSWYKTPGNGDDSSNPSWPATFGEISSLSIAAQVQTYGEQYAADNPSFLGYQIFDSQNNEMLSGSVSMSQYEYANNNNYFGSHDDTISAQSVNISGLNDNETYKLHIYFYKPSSAESAFEGAHLWEGTIYSDNEFDATFTKTTAAVPEPATMSLLGLGALAMVLRRKLRK